MVDEFLNWNEDSKMIKNKLAKGLSNLCYASKVLNISTLINVGYYFIYPYLTMY